MHRNHSSIASPFRPPHIVDATEDSGEVYGGYRDGIVTDDGGDDWAKPQLRSGRAFHAGARPHPLDGRAPAGGQPHIVDATEEENRDSRNVFVRQGGHVPVRGEVAGVRGERGAVYGGSRAYDAR
jgi:hypothetical protein